MLNDILAKYKLTYSELTELIQEIGQLTECATDEIITKLDMIDSEYGIH